MLIIHRTASKNWDNKTVKHNDMYKVEKFRKKMHKC